MQTYIDDRPITTTDDTLNAAIRAAADEAGSRLIIQATADGSDIPQADLDNPPETTPYCREIRFVTADRASIVRLTLQEAADRIESAPASHNAAAEAFQVGDTDAALESLREVLELWQATETTITTCQNVSGVSLNAPGTDLASASTDLAATLNEIKTAIESRDTATAADLLDGELTELTETWAELLRNLADNATENDA